MTDLKSKTVMVVTHSIFASQAERLARDFKKVYLVIPWQSHAFPTMQVARVGEGLEGVTKIDSMWGPELDECDIVIFPDLYFAAEQIRMEKMGKLVFGGRNGEEIELWRDTCKQVMESHGLPTQPWKAIKGITALREHLKTHENVHVKISKYRGSFETFKSESYEVSEPKLNELALKMGAFAEVADLIAEEDLPDRVEAGIDTFCVDGNYPSQTLAGVEIKNVGFAGEFVSWDAIPEPLRRWNEAMAPVFAKYGYRGWMSNEIRIGEDHEPYCIDPTCRSPSPPGELCQEFYTNYSEIIWGAANGEVVDPIPAAKFGVQVIMKSDFAEKHDLHIDFDRQYAKQIKLYNPARVDGKYYCIAQDEEMPECGSVIGWGDSLEKAFAHLKEAADTVKAYGIKIPEGSVEEAIEEMQKLTDIGLPLFSVDSKLKAE